MLNTFISSLKKVMPIFQTRLMLIKLSRVRQLENRPTNVKVAEGCTGKAVLSWFCNLGLA